MSLEISDDLIALRGHRGQALLQINYGSVLGLPVAYSRFGRLVVPTFQLLEISIRLDRFRKSAMVASLRQALKRMHLRRVQ